MNSEKYVLDLKIRRTVENGGDLSVSEYKELEKLFAEAKLHPGDLKSAVTDAINDFFNPVRTHFASTQAKMLASAFPPSKGRKK